MTIIIKKSSAKDLLKFAGVLKDLNINWEEVEERMKLFRNEFNERVKRTIAYMETVRLEVSR